jgi:anti-anti-sigma factor
MIRIERLPAGNARPAPTAPHPTVPAAPLPEPVVRVVRDLHSGLRVLLTEDGGRARAAVTGEVDFGCAGVLLHVLQDTLSDAPGGLDLDLSGVRFFDCSGMNVLLRLRTRAIELGVPLTVVRMSPAVVRVVQLTRSGGLFG